MNLNKATTFHSGSILEGDRIPPLKSHGQALEVLLLLLLSLEHKDERGISKTACRTRYNI